MKIYTKKGDDGTTGLLYGGRVAKDDLRTEVYGTLDETVSALGVARAGGLSARVEEIAVRISARSSSPARSSPPPRRTRQSCRTASRG